MFVPKEIAQNQVMRIPPVRRWARTKHRTGWQQDPVKGRQLYEKFRALAQIDLSSADVLELGPGRGTVVMLAARPDVGSYAAFDIEPYLDAAELARAGIDYRVDPDGTLPWAPASFDIVWSHSVLEHVRHPEAVLRDVRTVLRPGGLFLASIDLQDHYGNRRDPASMYGFMRYDERVWWWMTSHRGSYCNRLRASDWRELVGRHGFRVLREDVTPPATTIDELRKVPYLAGVSDSDLMAANLLLVLEATAGVDDGDR